MRRRLAILIVSLVASVLVPQAGPAAAAGPPLTGPDVSRWQHINGAPIDWSAVHASGQSFAFVQATRGPDTPNPYFAADWRDIAAAGMIRAAYHYAIPDWSPTSAADQARTFIGKVGTTQELGDLAPTLDLEQDNGLPPDALIRWAQSFLTTVEQLTGRTPIIYTYRYFWQTKMANTTAFKNYPLWIAQYTSATTPSYPLVGGWSQQTLWQYTSSGHLPGISGDVDISRFCCDLATLYAMADGRPKTAILDHYYALGGPSSFLGISTGGEYSVPGGRAQDFSGGTIYWSPSSGAREVHGAIGARFQGLGGPGGTLGLPTSDEYGVPGGRAANFVGGIVYWSPATTAHEMHGALLGHYLSLGGPAAGLGLPTSDETSVTGSPAGRRSELADGTLLWSPATGAHVVHGAISNRYSELGGPGGSMGLPTTDELGTPDRIGRFNFFTGGGIYWSPNSGAHQVQGAILAAWAAMGFERGFLGYPISNEYDVPDGRRSDFQGGWLLWDRASGTITIHRW